MADTQTSSSNGTPSSNGAAPSGEKVKIEVSQSGGGFSMDEFNRALGRETDNVDEPDEPEMEEGAGELLDSDDPPTKEKKKAPLDDDGEEEESDEEEGEDTDESADDDSDEEEAEGEESAELEELGKGVKKGAIKAYTKSGKAITLPPDLEIEQVVDGETRKINLREHLNVVAGELTVDSRLGKIGSFREQVETRRKEIEGIHGKFMDDINTLVGFAKEGKPDLAICYLAELNGMSPVQMKKQFLKAIVAEAAKFEGKSEVEIENYYLNLDRQWRDRKEQKQKERNKKQTDANAFVENVTGQLKREKISPEEFTAASQELKGKGELQNLSQDEAIDRVIEHALYSKHVNMAKSAIGLVDAKLVNNKRVFELLLRHTHPNEFTVEEMADVLSEYLGKTKTRIASGLSKKVQHRQVQAKSEKQNEAGKKQRTYRSQGDLGRAFGF